MREPFAVGHRDMLIFPGRAGEAPIHNGRERCHASIPEACQLASVDLVRIQSAIMDIDLGLCRAHAIAMARYSGKAWGDVCRDGDPYPNPG